MTEFTGKIAAVTGAASGLGRAVAIGLAEHGAERLILIDRDQRGLDATAAEIPSDTAVEKLAIDVSDAAAVQSVAAALPKTLPGLDILITAAGVLGPAVPIVDCPEEEWDRVFAVNVRGTYLCIRHFMPLIRARGRGSIVTFASTAGLVGSPVIGAYSASKGAVVLMTRSLALQHAAEGIRFNCVCPGSIETPMLEQTLSSAGDDAAVAARTEAYRQRHPMLRFGQADEVAAAVLFLASDAASYMTGVALPVDGGRLA